MEQSGCYHCEDEQAIENGALCEDCRADMWADQRTHQGRLDSRTVEDIELRS